MYGKQTLKQRKQESGSSEETMEVGVEDVRLVWNQCGSCVEGVKTVWKEWKHWIRCGISVEAMWKLCGKSRSCVEEVEAVWKLCGRSSVESGASPTVLSFHTVSTLFHRVEDLASSTLFHTVPHCSTHYKIFHTVPHIFPHCSTRFLFFPHCSRLWKLF